MYNEEFSEIAHLNERVNFLKLLNSSPNYFGNVEASKQKAVVKIIANTYYEEVMDVGYHPALEIVTATIHVKQPVGYLGNLCTQGSSEYVRFYLDYGAGWEDQGYVGVRVHDIPTGKDCKGAAEKPITYVADLKIKPRKKYCTAAVLPKLRAVLSWNSIPTSATAQPVWGNIYDCNIQIAPLIKWMPDPLPINIGEIFAKAIANPQLSLQQVLQTDAGSEKELSTFVNNTVTPTLGLKELSTLYTKEKVALHRFGFEAINAIQTNPDFAASQKAIAGIEALGFNWGEAVSAVLKTSADTSYEQLMFAGLDTNKSSFAATFNIKKPSGYSGDLCTTGSKEYIAFWADWDNNCKWSYVGTSYVNVHDIAAIPKGGLCYTAYLPYDFSKVARNCNSPKVVKIRAVLSWNAAPSTVNPDALNTWGNLLDAYVQIPPLATSTLAPVINILAGIPVDEINSSGVTTLGAAFALNGVGVAPGAPFAGRVVIQGQPFPGYKYRIKVTNVNTGAWYYVSDPFTATGWLPVSPWVSHTVSAPDSLGYYAYLSSNQNLDNILATWSPGTNDLLRIELEILGVPGVFTKYIQMDNTAPQAVLNINDMGDCKHFHQGDIITGTFTAADDYIASYTLSSTFSGVADSNNYSVFSKALSIPTAGTNSPCGKVSLTVTEKTIHDSAYTGVSAYAERIICLQ